jgi:hypothetical protein
VPRLKRKPFSAFYTINDNIPAAMLFTFHVSSGAKQYVTQLSADDWEGAKRALITSEGFRQFAEATMPVTVGAAITDADVS